jgi:hypothetical protein
MRRPYFASARQFFEAMAPTYGLDTRILARYVENPDGFVARPQPQNNSDAPAGGGGHRRRRRRRRGGRMHRRDEKGTAAAQVLGAAPAASASAAISNGDARVEISAESSPPSRAPHSEPRS